MWTINNKGSITVEMCFVMPIVITVVMLLVSVILRGLNEGTALGFSQSMVYEYNDFNQGGKLSNIPMTDIERLENTVILSQITGSFDITDHSVSVGITSIETDKVGSISKMGCKRERNKCTERLRRWQLYGNVLCD